MKREELIVYVCKCCGWRGVVCKKFSSREILQERHNEVMICPVQIELVQQAMKKEKP